LSLTSAPFDYTTAGSSALNGISGTNYTVISSKNIMWAGNANSNANVRFNGLANDKDYLYINILGSNSGLTLSNVYSEADLNMNRSVRYNGLANDKDFLFINILGSAAATTRTQALPN